MLFATTAPSLLIFALALGLLALGMLDTAPHVSTPAAVVSTGGDN